MANIQGRYTGETIIGTIGEDVGLGQVVYSRTISTTNPDIQNRGVWFAASADEINEVWIEPGLMPKYVSSNQLGVVVQAASYSTISSTQSGTKTTILLNGYYSPGFMARPGEPDTNPDMTGYFYAAPGAACGAPLYLLPKEITALDPFYPFDPITKNTKGGFSCWVPTSDRVGGATAGAVRIIGYAYDITYPYVVRFDPDNTWIEF
jgi:hypothetical protein